MSRIVLDTSAILALIENEPGAENVQRIISQAAMSTVNLAEVYSKLSERGDQGRQAFAILRGAIGRLVPFTAHMAETSGALRPLTRHLGLSLGDRACLALALTLDAEVYTADRLWAELGVRCKIHLIR